MTWLKHAALILPLVATAAAAQEAEDAAHRADRLETQRLNTRSSNGYAPTSRKARPDGQRDYRRALDDYEQRLEAWRRRVAACEAGDYDACA